MYLITTIHKAHQAVRDVFNDVSEGGPTPTQLIVLAALAEREYTTQGELCRATGVDRSTMTDVISRLVRLHYVTRKQLRRDARVKTPRITPRGRGVVNHAMLSVPRIEAELQARMPELRSLRTTAPKIKKAA